MRREELRKRLLETELFSSFSAAALDELLQVTTVSDYAAGQRVLLEGDPSREIFCLLTGVVGVFYSSPEGTDVLVKIFGAPAVFGEMELIYGQPRQEYVETFENALVAKIPGALFLRKMRAEVSPCYIMLRDVCTRLSIAAYHERALAFLDVPTRLAGLLLSFAEAYAEDVAGGVRLKKKLTYEVLAKCLAVTTRSIDRAMKVWRDEGWLKKDRGHLVFTSLEELEDRADEERQALFTSLGLSK